MKHRAFGASAIVLSSLLLFCLGCSPAGSLAPTTYSEIFIDTYDPIDSTGANAALYSTYLELWSSDGKTKLAFYDGIDNTRLVNQYYAFIDYTSGLTSGDYWVLIKESGSGGHSFPYAIRVLATPDSNYTPWVFISAATETTSDQPLVGGGPPWPPAPSQTIVYDGSDSNKLNRFIVAGGVNWVKIHLP